MKPTRSFLATLALMVSPLCVLAGPVDINTANAETLASELNGVGISRANAIVAYRNVHGSFLSADDLLNVSGIGQATVDQNRKNILVKSGPSAKTK